MTLTELRAAAAAGSIVTARVRRGVTTRGTVEVIAMASGSRTLDRVLVNGTPVVAADCTAPPREGTLLVRRAPQASADPRPAASAPAPRPSASRLAARCCECGDRLGRHNRTDWPDTCAECR